MFGASGLVALCIALWLLLSSAERTTVLNQEMPMAMLDAPVKQVAPIRTQRMPQLMTLAAFSRKHETLQANLRCCVGPLAGR